MDKCNNRFENVGINELVKLSNDLEDDKQINPYYFSLQKASPVFLRSTLEIWDNLGIKLHKVGVLESKNDIYLAKVKKYSNMISDYLEKRIVITNPSNITIELSPSFIFYFLDSPYLEGTTFRKDDSDDGLDVFTKVKLSRYNKYVTATHYNHEIAHTQVPHIDIEDTSFSKEVIPILFEELSALNIDKSGRLLKEVRLLRLNDLSNDLESFLTHKEKMNYNVVMETIGYIQSTLEAISLMNTYLKGDSSLKKEMCQYINSILSNKRNVQDILDYYDCNVDQVSKDLKVLKRTRFK